MAIQLPRQVTKEKILSTITAITRIMECEDDPLEIDCQRTEFIDPLGLCLLLHAGLDAKEDWDQEVNFLGFQPNILSYIERMDVFKHLGISSGLRINRNDRSDRLVETRIVKSEDEMEETADSLARALVGSIKTEHSIDPSMEVQPRENALKNIKYILAETLANSLTHANRGARATDAKVYVSAQYFEKNDRVVLAIVDNGQGIRSSLQRVKPELRDPSKDIEAIQEALKPGVSCNPTVGTGIETSNQGIGLTVCHQMVSKAQGNTMLGSGQGALHTMKSQSREINLQSYWEGTFFVADVPRSRLLEVDMEAIFSSLEDDDAEPELYFED